MKPEDALDSVLRSRELRDLLESQRTSPALTPLHLWARWLSTRSIRSKRLLSEAHTFSAFKALLDPALHAP